MSGPRGEVAIIGGGLGGLTAALALLRAGWRVRVYEQAPVLGEVGAGITISSGAGRGLASLGLADALLAASLPVPDVAFVHYRSARLLAGKLDRGTPPDRGFETARHIHRADLHGILLRAVLGADPGAVVTSKTLLRTEQDDRGVIARFADGSSATADFLVAADGARSTVRRQMFEDGEPQFAGQVAFRCLIPYQIAAPFMASGNAVVSVGPGRIFHRYVIRGGALVNVIGIAQSKEWQAEGWNTRASVAEFLEMYGDFHGDVTGLITHAPPESLIKWGLFVRPPVARWHRDRIVLLGDAAHPILPFLGLGAALAMEDGVVLARALGSTDNLAAAFCAYQAARLDRVETVRLQSIRQGEIVQATDPDHDELTRSPSQNVSLFDYNPCTVPIHV